MFAETAARHVITLGLEQPQEVHEQDQAAVEGLINKMQHGRVYTVSWTYASLISLLGRTRPPYEADRAIGIQAGAGKQKGGRSAQNASSPAGGVQLSGEMGLSFSRESHCTEHDLDDADDMLPKCLPRCSSVRSLASSATTSTIQCPLACPPPW